MARTSGFEEAKRTSGCDIANSNPPNDTIITIFHSIKYESRLTAAVASG